MKRNTSGRSYFCDWYEKYCLIVDIVILIGTIGIYSILAIVIEGNIDYSNIIWIFIPSGITWLTIHTILVISASESSENKRKIEKQDKGG